jgi:branched-chain amino acid transport system substrate-binding protein
VASFGVSTRNGIQLAVDQANASGGVRGRPLELLVSDAKGSADLAAREMDRLITEQRVRLVLGEIESTNSIAMGAVAQARKVPMISPASTNPRVTEGRDFVSRVCFVDPFQGFVMAKFARDNLRVQRVGVVGDPNSDYSTGLADVFTRKFTEMGGKVVAQERYAKDDRDFRAQIGRLMSARPEAVYMPGYYGEVASFAKQAQAMGLRVPLLGGDGWASDKLFELGGRAMEGHYFSDHYSPEDPSPRSQRFIADYRKAFGAVPDSLAALGYDAARVAIEAMKRAQNVDGQALREEIARTRDFPGVTGNISLDVNRNAVKPAVVLQIVDGKPKFVTTVSP